jgi:hypothetical protein
LDSSVAFASGKTARTVATRSPQPKGNGVKPQAAVAHFEAPNDTRGRRSRTERYATFAKQKATVASYDRGRSAPSYANACNEQLFTPEIESTNNDQQEETTLGRPFPASSMLQAIA